MQSRSVPLGRCAWTRVRVYDSDKNEWEMGSEHLDTWDATLRVCLARVLDDGADASRVLDHLAGTIASTHIPTGASATNAAELMLSHLETPPDAPALLCFANDTLIARTHPSHRTKSLRCGSFAPLRGSWARAPSTSCAKSWALCRRV
jgi:hypothetical protein